MRKSKKELSHLNASGEAHMVDVGDKTATQRSAQAETTVHLSSEALEALKSGSNKKGDVLATARIAGIQAAKKTAELIPLCHNIPLEKVEVELFLEGNQLKIRTVVRNHGKTGVEMEALCAASVAALTVYDMLKAIDKGIEVGPLRLMEKDGGKSGHWQR